MRNFNSDGCEVFIKMGSKFVCVDLEELAIDFKYKTHYRPAKFAITIPAVTIKSSCCELD